MFTEEEFNQWKRLSLTRFLFERLEDERQRTVDALTKNRLSESNQHYYVGKMEILTQVLGVDTYTEDLDEV